MGFGWGWAQLEVEGERGVRGAVMDGWWGWLRRTQCWRQLNGDVVVTAGGAATRAGGGIATHHHATPHHLQPAPCNITNTKHYILIIKQHAITNIAIPKFLNSA